MAHDEEQDHEYQGVERRKCSDRVCREAREEWLNDTLMPKIRIQNAMMIGATVIFCSSVFLYLSNNSIRDYDLRARDVFVSAQRHREEIGRIEQRIEKMEQSVTAAMDLVIERLDRNLAEIRARR